MLERLRVTQGERLSAAKWNELVDALEAALRGGISTGVLSSIAGESGAAVAATRPLEWVEGKLDGALSPAGTATLSVWHRTKVLSAGPPPLYDVEDSGRNVTVTDRLQWTVSAGKWVVAIRINGEWRPIAAEC